MITHEERENFTRGLERHRVEKKTVLEE